MPKIELPAIASVLPIPGEVVWLTPQGEAEWLGLAEANKRMRTQSVLFCHKKMLAVATGIAPARVQGLDVLELYAFVRPARFAVPTVAGLAKELGLPPARNKDQETRQLAAIVQKLLEELADLADREKQDAAAIAGMMTQGDWGWGKLVLTALAAPMPSAGGIDTAAAQIWDRLPDVPENTQPPAAGDKPLEAWAAIGRLKDMLGKNAIRPGQEKYCRSLTPAFMPQVKNEGSTASDQKPQLVLATAGTGTGKTLGYLAPATVWAENNGGNVWISTYTRSLQHQIETETTRLYTDRDARSTKVVTRKGRENYLCLRNFAQALEALSEDAATRQQTLHGVIKATDKSQKQDAIALGIMARWARAAGDGDLTGDHFPAWLVDLFEKPLTRGLSDKPGECIYTACDHYQKCFIEANRARARARESRVIIANHAVVMMMAKINSIIPREDRPPPTRYVFDEGHHLFEAADSAFAVLFTAKTTSDLRLWLRGDEARRRGISHRLDYALRVRRDAGEALTKALAEARAALGHATNAASFLPATNWKRQISPANPDGAMAQFLRHIRQLVYAKPRQVNPIYSLERALYPLDEGLLSHIAPLSDGLAKLADGLQRLIGGLKVVLADESEALGKQDRQVIDGVMRGLMWRAVAPLHDWLSMLDDISSNSSGQAGEFIDWLQVTRSYGEEEDVGLHRHWRDPTKPFYDHVLKRAHGAVITSASLTDSAGPRQHATSNRDWQFAESLVGARHVNQPPPARFEVASPFDYRRQARIFVATDMTGLVTAKSLTKDQAANLADGIGRLMLAAGGDALALFTAIKRIRDIYPHLAQQLAEEGVPLYAQHIGKMDLQTLVQIFRNEPRSCIMGTNALRDGIDVPGDALRLIIFDRLPWQPSSILSAARAEAFGRTAWHEYFVRMKLRQAFGRLIRHEHDRGVFVMLDYRMVSRFSSAFPPGVEVVRAPLAEIIAGVKRFFAVGD